MIAHLSGKLGLVHNQSCILHTGGGVGYLVNLPAHTCSTLPIQGEPVEFHISMVVREDAMELFGFATLEERQTFDILRSISRIGSRTALAILSTYRPAELHNLVLEKNQAALAKIPGIGAKTAQHLLLELNYRLKPLGTTSTLPPLPSAQKETLDALANLGYCEEECAGIVKDVFETEPDLDTPSAIRLALKKLARGKS